jgi:hypothetical protein
MAIIEEHRTPDGLLRFIVERDDDGNISLGFDGFPSHTRADILASSSGLPVQDAIREYVDRLLNGRSLICITSVAGRVRDVSIADDTRSDKFKPDGETMQFRFWDGRSVS